MKKISAILAALAILSACSNDPAKAWADYETAVKYLRGEGVALDQAKGTEYLMRAAKEGNADAKLALGFSYMKGRGVEKDLKRAFENFLAAAEQGLSDAQYNVGLSYIRAQGTEKNYAKAAEWFEKSALQADAGSQYNLGVMYFNGEGVTRNPVQAYVWFRLAADRYYDGAAEGMEKAKNSIQKEMLPELDRAVAKTASKIKSRTAPIPVGNWLNQPL